MKRKITALGFYGASPQETAPDHRGVAMLLPTIELVKRYHALRAVAKEHMASIEIQARGTGIIAWLFHRDNTHDPIILYNGTFDPSAAIDKIEIYFNELKGESPWPKSTCA